MHIAVITDCAKQFKNCMGRFPASPNNKFKQVRCFNDILQRSFGRVLLAPDSAYVKDSEQILTYVRHLRLPITYQN